MTNLRLFETDSGATAEHTTTSHLFETPPRSERYVAGGWPYATSMVLHSIAMISIVILGRYLTQAPPPIPSHPNRKLVHTFVLTGFGVGRNNRPRAAKTQHPDAVTVAAANDVAPAPSPPPARGDSSTLETRSIVDEKPPQPAFDPPIP